MKTWIAPAPGRLRRDLLVTALAFALLLAWDLAGLDLAVTRWYGSAHGFAWRTHALTATLLHEGGRVLAWAAFALLVVNVQRPLIAGPGKVERLRWVLVTAACVLLVPAAKQLSHTSCPWDLQEFGGIAAYVPHWQWGTGDGGPGRCFPSGHAVSAFAFFSGYFVLRPHHDRVARWWLAAVLVVGAVLGWGQLARGAHYVSHTLWSAWLSWVICLVLASTPRPRLNRPAANALPG